MTQTDLSLRSPRAWRAAEQRLYTLVLTAPELYELSLGLVRAVADDLADVVAEPALVRLYDTGAAADVVRRVATGLGVDLALVDVDAVTAAACSLRYGELVAAHARQEAHERVQEARAAGAAWVVLHESGTEPEPGRPCGGYHRVEASLEAPWGVHVSATFDIEANTMVYLVEPVAVDLDDATWWIPDDVPPVPERTCADVAAWRDAARDMRRTLARA